LLIYFNCLGTKRTERKKERKKKWGGVEEKGKGGIRKDDKRSQV
jgi:hypothetical protein